MGKPAHFVQIKPCRQLNIVNLYNPFVMISEAFFASIKDDKQLCIMECIFAYVIEGNFSLCSTFVSVNKKAVSPNNIHIYPAVSSISGISKVPVTLVWRCHTSKRTWSVDMPAWLISVPVNFQRIQGIHLFDSQITYSVIAYLFSTITLPYLMFLFDDITQHLNNPSKANESKQKQTKNLGLFISPDSQLRIPSTQENLRKVD